MPKAADQSKSRLFYQDDHSKVYHGDCLEVMREEIEPASIDLIVTSPPYNVNKAYGQYEDRMDYYVYIEWLKEFIDVAQGVLTYGGRIAININDNGRKPLLPTHAYVAQHLDESNLHLMACVIWDKGSPGTTTWGSWESASSPCFRGQHEYILIAAKDDFSKKPRINGAASGPWFHIKNETGEVTEKDFVRLSSEVWRFQPATHPYHPAPFPFELPARLIRFLTFKGDVVLDPFVGTGTTLRAARYLDRDCIGIDLDKEYCRIARDSIRQQKLFEV